MIITIIAFIIIFGILVLVHEYGHYFFAKRAGILVREFSIGMGPKIWWKRRHGTTYTIRILPLGGYVRMAGMDDDSDSLRPGLAVSLLLNDQGKVTTINASNQTTLFQGVPLRVVDFDLEKNLWISGYLSDDETEVKRYDVDHDATIIEKDGTEVRIAPLDVQFNSASLPARMMTNLAGAMNNFILSLVVFVIVGFMVAAIPTNSNRLGLVVNNSPAAKAGLKANDQITKINSTTVKNWDTMSSYISDQPGKKLQITFVRNGVTHHTSATTKKIVQNGQSYGQLGITEKTTTNFKARLGYGWHMFTYSATLIFTTLGHMFTRGFSLNDLGGPVAIYAGTSQATSLGVTGVLSFLATLSINLGIVNLLPIPALDGGKLLLNICEAIIRRPIPEKFELAINLIGFAFLMLLMILVTWNDIQRYFM